MAASSKRRAAGRTAERAAGGEAALPELRVPTPAKRRLRVFALDPSLATQVENAGINETTIEIPWEPEFEGSGDPAPGTLGPGPVGEYVEVVDHDPFSGCFYAPVDLNDPKVLAEDGLAPTEGNPQFHQQMAYAVSMRVIDAFEGALGRRVLWAPLEPARNGDGSGKSMSWGDRFVRRLRIYPHALREANAFYSPPKRSLLFGYFPAEGGDEVNLPGGTVFTCLSHDVAAHETTHAVLDGMNRLMREPSNPDVLAFHEAFSDIVAIFHHFSIPAALRQEMGKTRGDLRRDSLLAGLAQQFGRAIGSRASLRNALGTVVDGRQGAPDRAEIDRVRTPHERGAILVAAVFDAFLTVFEKRSTRIILLATGGTGVLPQGRLPVLVLDALCEEAAKVAGHFLRICIRALDYCPPADLTFGEYLRALITADYDRVKMDPWGYRVAFVEAFRRRGIYPWGVRSLSVESLLWRGLPHELPGREMFADRLKKMRGEGAGVAGGREVEFDPAADFSRDADRFHIFVRSQRYAQALQNWVDVLRRSPDGGASLGLALGARGRAFGSLRRDKETKKERVWVRSVRPAQRTDDLGRTRLDLVVEVVQTRGGYFDPKRQAAADAGDAAGEPDFSVRGGATLMISPDDGECRYAIWKNVLSEDRLEQTRRLLSGDAMAMAIASRAAQDQHRHEPFAMTHRC